MFMSISENKMWDSLSSIDATEFLRSTSVGRRTLWPANTLAVANHRGARERIAVHVSLPSVHGDSLRPKCSPAKVFAGQSVAGQRVPRRTDAHGDSLRGPHGDSLRPRW
uniref:Uncharacterized protein n=1 Tax=Trichuris muris TaxID=70415 RepID=A0A5S6Q5Z4_TRIMR